jgi:Amt family ammonium transporter
VGTIATGIFAEKAVNAAGNNGLLFGNIHQFLVQGIMWIAAVVFAVVMTYILYKIVDAIIGMRVEEKNEIVGLDLTQQSEAAYTVIE